MTSDEAKEKVLRRYPKAVRETRRGELTPLRWQAIMDALLFTSEHAGCVSDAHIEAIKLVKKILAIPITGKRNK